MARREVHNGCPPGEGTVETATGGRIGNPPHEWSQEIADKVREFGELCNRSETARRSGISEQTLRRHYPVEWQEAQEQVVYDTKAMMIKAVREERSVNAGKVVLAMCGALTRKVEVAGPGGGPIRALDMAVLAQLVDGKDEQELAALEQALSLVLAATGESGGPGDGSADAESREGDAPEA